MGKNYYEVLGIVQNATTKEIKSAYIVKIRQYPVEFHPDQFRLIREAYDVLSNEEQRAKYDLEVIHGDELSELLESAHDAYDNEDYELAQHYFEKVLQINPDETGTINIYALSLLKTGDYDHAIAQFKKAISLKDDNSTFYFNLASAYERKEDYDLAIRNYKQALLRKPSDFEIVDRLSYLYFELDDFENAWNILEITMNKQKVNGQIRFMYIKSLVQLAVLNNAKLEIKIALKYANKFINELPEEQDFALMELADLCIQLAKAKNYKAARPIIDWVVSIDNDPKYKELQSSIHEDDQIYSEFHELFEDEQLISEIRYKAYLYLFSDDVEDFETESNNVNENILDACEYDPQQVRSSIKRMKTYYPSIYKQLNSWFKTVESYI